MAVVRLRAPLTELTGGKRELQLDGATVREVLRALEAGASTDRRLDPRRAHHDPEHINVFVNGERGREDTALAPDDRIHVLPSISGG